MNLGQLKETTCSPTACAEKFMQFISNACDKYEIKTPVIQVCFLSQLGHKSGDLFYKKINGRYNGLTTGLTGIE